jgi:hypothetical protein
MWGKIAVIGIVTSAAFAGVFVYYTQVYAFYKPVSFTPGEEILLTPIVSGTPEAILAENVQGIDSESSPLRFRACFTTPMDLSMLTETYVAYPEAVPLTAPGWFDCFDAAAIGAALEAGEALPFLSETEIHPGVDRVVAVFADGRAYAWHQLNGTLGN